jgi:catechol 2,3-dioxygenase-like lactoylglutathione lyase family enzyme
MSGSATSERLLFVSHEDLVTVTVVLLFLASQARHPSPSNSTFDRSHSMHLGHFSISLAVKDLATSRAFYEKLGFEVIGGHAEQNWLILQNGDSTIGLFQGMFERNMLTFNPGWDARAHRLEEFTDVRDIQRHLKEHGLALTAEADESTTGPANLMLIDPDGNPVLIDQHVD